MPLLCTQEGMLKAQRSRMHVHTCIRLQLLQAQGKCLVGLPARWAQAGQKPLVRKGNDPWAEVHRLREENARLQRQAEQNSHRDEEPSTSDELARLVVEVQESARELHLVRPCKQEHLA